MATTEQEQDIRRKLSERLTELESFRKMDLTRDKELGTTLNFSNGKPYFERILNLYQELANCDLNRFPFNTLNQLNSHAQAVVNLLTQVVNFNPSQQGNPGNARDVLINSIRDAYDTHYSILIPHVTYSLQKGLNLDELQKNAESATESLNKFSTEVKDNAEKLKKESESILKAMQEAAAKTGVSRHAANFKDQADEHQNASSIWLGISVSCILIGLLTLFALFVWPFHPETASFETTGRAVYAIVSRLLVFSTIYSAIYLAVKNYASNRHNYVVNRHRQNALSTFQTFVKAAGDDEMVKNAVLLHASHSIFSSQPSGYTDLESTTQLPTSPIEIIKQVFPQGNK